MTIWTMISRLISTGFIGLIGTVISIPIQTMIAGLGAGHVDLGGVWQANMKSPNGLGISGILEYSGFNRL